jgi:hypothetical protein
MRRNSLVLGIGALAGAALIVVVAVLLGPFELGASEEPRASDPVGGGAADIPWAFFSQVPPDGGPGRFVIQAGMFGDDRPRVDIEVPWVVDVDLDLARSPAVGRPAAGAVIYVADDGITSTVQRLPIEAGATPEAVAEVDDSVWSIAVAPDGSVAYLAVVTRGQPDDDRGVLRVALDGSGAVEPLLGPVDMQGDGDVRLAAIAPFSVTLDIAADGRYLARTACRGPAGCETSLIDLSTRGEVELDAATALVDPGADGMIIVETCGQAGCAAELMEVETGTSLALRSAGFDTAIATVGGRAVVVGIETAEDGSTLTVSDPRSGARRELHRVTEGAWMVLGARTQLVPAVDGAVIVVESTEERGVMRERYLLVPLGGGPVVPLPAPAIRPVGPPAAKG